MKLFLLVFSSCGLRPHRSLFFVKKHRHQTETPDEKLFRGMPEEIQRLHKQSKRELRLKRREEFARKHGLK